MNEENDVIPEMPDSIQQQRQETYENSTLFDSSAEDELNTVLTAMKALPFGDERQKDAFFENVQRLQGYHVIQIFNLGVASLQKYYMKESSEFLEEAMNLFEICLSFCYADDVSKRVAFDYYVRALKFCFPSQPKQFLSTTVVSMLLQLVQILQEGKLATIVCEKDEQGTNSKTQIKGTKYFIAELLAIFETRRDRDEGCITEIVAQTKRIASKDVSVTNTKENVEENLRSEHAVSPYLLTNWIKLLQLESVNNAFASGLAKLDTLSCTVRHFPICLPSRFTIHTSYLYESTIAHLVSILEEIKSTGSDVILPTTEERLAIFFKHVDNFCHNAKVTVALLKVLVDESISSEVQRAVLDQFFFEEKRKFGSYQQCVDWIEIKARAVDLVSKVLSLLPDGEVVNKLLKFWKASFAVDPDYQTLVCMLSLFLEGSSSEGSCCLQERAEKTLEFLDCLDRPLLNLITSWYPFLAWFIREFPTSFHDQRRTDGLRFIRSASRVARLPSGQKGIFVRSVEQFFDWASKQNCTEEMKDEIVQLLMCCTDSGALLRNWEFSIDVIKQMILCKQLPFSSKKAAVLKLNDLAKHFKEKEPRSVLQDLVKRVISNQSLQFKAEILFEVTDVIRCCADKDRSTETIRIPSYVVELMSLLSYSPISGDRMVKVLKKSKESGKSMLIGKRVLELVEWHCSNEGADEYFDLLYSAFVDILNGDKDLCEQFYAESKPYCHSVTSQFVWSFVVCRLLSSGLFSEEIDSRCCLTVLEAACGFNSPFEVLHLFSHVRLNAEKIVHVFKKESNTNSSLGMDNCLLKTFASSLSTIVGSDVLSGQEKLLLVKKVCDIFFRCPDSLTGQMVEKALINLIPFPHWQNGNSSSGQEVSVMHLELNEIMVMLENPMIVAQLSRVPVSADMSLSTVLSTMDCHSSSRDTLTDLYHFTGSLDDVDEAFFRHLLPVLEIAIKMLNSLEDVLDILRELVCFIRDVPPELIPLITVNFGYLLENQVNEQERKRFFDEVIMKWSFSPNPDVLSYLKIPRLLWTAYTAADTPAKRCELIDRLQEILRKTTEKVESYCEMGQNLRFLAECDNIRTISCCELEWLVFHSSLSTDEAALAYNLSFRLFNPKLRCFTLSDVQIEEGVFAFERQETSPKQSADKKKVSTSSIVASVTIDSPATEQGTPIVTPLSVAQKMIQVLKRSLGVGKDLAEIAFSLWDFLFSSISTTGLCDAECKTRSSFIDDDVEVLLSVLSEASSRGVVLYWTNLNRHLFSQCSDVILKACKKANEANSIEKGANLNFHSKVHNTLETMQMSTLDTSCSVLPRLWSPTSCFRLVKPQLKHLSIMLESRLPIEETSLVLDLFQINVQAGISVNEIVSSWSCTDEAVQLIESVKLSCQDGDVSSLSPAQSEFVWQLLKAFGRFCMNSCKNLLDKLKKLIVLHDPENSYGLNRLPKWREMMISDGFPAHVIDCWCVVFLVTPLKGLSSRDVDAIVDLNSHSFQLVAPVSHKIKSCLFPEDGFEVTQAGINEPQTKERLRLARLLSEFINVLRLRKPEENSKDAVIKGMVVDACNKLCRSHEDESKRKSDLYKIHGRQLKTLFTEIFGKQRRSDDEVNCAGMVHQAREEDVRRVLLVSRQSSLSVLSHTEVYEPFLVLLRRWLSRVVAKPVLASHTREIVQLLLSVHPSEDGPAPLEEIHGIIKAHVLSLENNKALIAQLHAAGYNQNEQGTPDLWSSPVVECFGYLSKSDSKGDRRFKKKLTKVLRCLWNEWKDILSMCRVTVIKVSNTNVLVEDLFGAQASLEEMEDQVSAVKKEVSQIESQKVVRRVKQLMRQEQRHRERIGQQYESNKVRNLSLILASGGNL